VRDHQSYFGHKHEARSELMTKEKLTGSKRKAEKAPTRSAEPKRKTKAATPLAWPVVGSIVDYCAVIGREPTERALAVTVGPEWMGGEWVVWLHGKSACVWLDACRPAASNEAPADVQVEIRAAELEPAMNGGAGRVSWDERDGARHHAEQVGLNGSSELPGWLAREIATHDDRETRDADAWAWDITRPVAGQYEEQRRIHQDVVAALAETDARVTEHTRHGGSASVARHADLDDEIDDDQPTDPATKFGAQARQVTMPVTPPGRVPHAEDQPTLPVVGTPKLDAQHEVARDVAEPRQPRQRPTYRCTACGAAVTRWEDMLEYQHSAPCYGLVQRIDQAPVLPPLTPAEERAERVMQVADCALLIDVDEKEVDERIAAAGLVRFEIEPPAGSHDRIDCPCGHPPGEVGPCGGCNCADFSITGHNGGVTVEMLADDADGIVAIRSHADAWLALQEAVGCLVAMRDGEFTGAELHDALDAIATAHEAIEALP
jgi:hypothetical protein